MDCLNDLGLLQNVRSMSTVSGGTFTGVAYFLALKDGKSFTEFRDGFKTWLWETQLIDLALHNLGAGQPGQPEGPWTVIRAAAEVYDRHLTRGKTFGSLWEGPATHLEDVCYNATEFRTGNSFRFRYTPGTNRLIGNRNVPLAPEIAKQVRLADIIASSSCFPGGFEPMGFPYEYTWPATAAGQEARTKVYAQFPEALPLMDGGVFDNQGIQSLIPLTADEQQNYDLFIFSDVYQRTPSLFSLNDWPYHSPYQGPGNYATGEGVVRLLSELTLHTVDVISWTAMVSSAVAAVGCFWLATQFWGMNLATFAALFAGVVVTGLAGLLHTVRQTFKHAFKQIPQACEAAWDDLKWMTVGQLELLIKRRTGSVFALTSDVFMKRVRGLVYGRVYQDDHLEHRRLASLVYDLAGGDEKLPEESAEIAAQKAKVGAPQTTYPEWLKPTEKMRAVARVGADMKTTLWFDYPEQRDCLVLSGRMTLVWKFLRYLIRHHGEDLNSYSPARRALFERARGVFEQCKQASETMPLPPS
jgi:hypothetical protein